MGDEYLRLLKHWLVVLLSLGQIVAALQPDVNDVYVRVVDVGAGLCAVVRMPGDYYMIYDAGSFSRAFDAVSEIIPQGETIDLLVLSHSDADHIGAVDEILDAYKVRRILHSGFPRDTNAWRHADRAIRAEHEQDGAIEISLRYSEFPLGATYQFGETYVTMVAGFYVPPESWDIRGVSEHRNAGSIVVRLEYRGKSILFTGDIVGRHINDPPDINIAGEKYLVDNADVIKIDSDVLIAPHHGADNGSSTAFIEAVSPKFVIFSAGHQHRHPREVTAQRYLAQPQLTTDEIFRTDLGDNEGGSEWSFGRTPGPDPVGDDDVDILLTGNGTVQVEYRRYHER